MRASELSQRLGENALAVCRRYLSNGWRAGRYWLVGDVRNTKGRSLYVRLAGPGKVGKWNDTATQEHGDLLDIIRLSQGLPDLRAAMEEARDFLRIAPAPMPLEVLPSSGGRNSSANREGLARHIFAEARPVVGTLGEAYLQSRGIGPEGWQVVWQADRQTDWWPSLRFHPRVWFDKYIHRPALLAASRDNAGNLTGITRFFLDHHAGLIERRALGTLNGRAVRLVGRTNSSGPAHLIVGEGLESTLSFPLLYPEQTAGCDLVAAMSSAHLAAFVIPRGVTHLTIATDNDPTGRDAAAKLERRALSQGVATRVALPRLGDFNDDWRAAQNAHVA